MKLNKKGFTLVEVLIVVVILAILAALILPRLLSQPERAVIAEAQQMLGRLRRAQLQNIDLTGGVGEPFDCSAAPGCAVPELTRINVGAIPDSSSFGYQCTVYDDNGTPADTTDDTASECIANRIGGTFNGATITIQVGGNSDGEFSCAAGYVLVDTNDPTRGCTAS